VLKKDLYYKCKNKFVLNLKKWLLDSILFDGGQFMYDIFFKYSSNLKQSNNLILVIKSLAGCTWILVPDFFIISHRSA
jgi:hypothetical protein